jgi:diacylglycerol kinase (ATP)
MKPGHTGIRRILYAFRFSVQGLVACWRHESAFRQEAVVCLVVIPLGLVLGGTGVERALLVASVLLVPVVELLNTAVETVVDRVDEGPHPLAGRAKDIGSAAVLLAIVLALVVWVSLLVPRYLA